MKQVLIDVINSAKLISYEEVPGNVLLVRHKSKNDHLLSNIYIDYSDRIYKSSEDALRRQKEIIENDFFRSTGNAQWNFYYYYLLSKEKFDENAKTKWVNEVQIDTNYARKRVLTLESLKSSFPFSSILNRTSVGNTKFTDLANQWIRILRDAELDEVFTDDIKTSTFDGAVERYLRGAPIKEAVEEAGPSGATITKTSGHIESITLKNYRSFPKGKVVSFSNVNLLEGRNGSGKTSILEALELVLCGKTYRHEGLPIESADIMLKYTASDVTEAYEPKGLKKFQDKEQFWYGIPPSYKKNTLYKSFNRFNFFNTDASYRFSTMEEPKAIWNSFISLALGGKTSELSKRIEGFYDRFQNQEKRIAKELVDLASEIGKLKSDLEILKKASETRLFNVAILSECYNAIGINPVPNIDDTALLATSRILADAKAKIGSLVEHFPERERITLSEINSIQVSANALKESLAKLDNALATLDKRKSQIDLQLTGIHDKRAKLARLKNYFEVDGAKDIDAIQATIQKMSERIVQAQKQLQRLTAADFSQDILDNELMSKAILLLEREASQLFERKQNAEGKATRAKEAVSAKNALIAEIKALGKQYLSHSSDGKCPMCESLLERSNLEQKIEQINLADDLLPELLNEKATADALHERAMGELNRLKRLFEVATFSSPESDYSSATVGQIKTFCQKLEANLTELISSQSEKQAHIAVLLSQGFSIKEFTDLCREISISPKNRMTNEMLNLINEQQNHLDQIRDGLESELGEINTNIQNTISQFKSSNAEFNNKGTLQELRSSVLIVIGTANAFHFSLEGLKEAFPNIVTTSPLRQLESLVKSAQAETTEHQSFLAIKKQKSIAIDQQTSQIADKEAAIVLKRAAHQQAERAVNALKQINEEYGRDQAVKKFFDQNKPVIVEIFKAIHAPNEFDDIILEAEKVYVSKDGKKRELSEISTGQRTAVALSVFFGLHLSCPLAPKAILFDDPVAFVDDLNVLAFLDFLRELSIAGERQIFFATANKKLASLMRRKFDDSGIGFSTIDPLKE